MDMEQRQRLAAIIGAVPNAAWVPDDETRTFTAYVLHAWGYPQADTVMDLQWPEQDALEEKHGLDGLMLARMETIEEDVTTAEEARRRLLWYVLDEYLPSCQCERCDLMRRTKGYAGDEQRAERKEAGHHSR